MRLLIKYIESRGAGKEVSQFSFDGDVATIGRGTDQTIQISDRRLPLSHSRLTLAGGKLTLASHSTLSRSDGIDTIKQIIRSCSVAVQTVSIPFEQNKS